MPATDLVQFLGIRDVVENKTMAVIYRIEILGRETYRKYVF